MRMLLTAVAVACTTCTAHAADIYVDFQAPGGGDGSAVAPFNSLHDVSPSAGDTVFMTGVSRDAGVEYAGLANVEFTRWPGRSRPVLRGDVALTGEWFEHASGVYGVAIPAGVDIGPPARGVMSVMEDWDVRIDALGRHYGHMPEVDWPNQVLFTSGSWYLDYLGNQLLVNVPDDVSPNESGRTYTVQRNEYGLNLVNPVNVTVAEIDLMFWGFSAIRVTGGSGLVIRDVESVENLTISIYDHTGVSIEDLTIRGYAGPDANWTRPAALEIEESSGEVRDAVIHAFPRLGVDAMPIDRPRAHAISVLGDRDDPSAQVVVRRTRMIGYDGIGEAIFLAGSAHPPTNPLEHTQYQVQFVDCAVENAAQLVIGAAAMVQCAIDVVRPHDVPLGDFYDIAVSIGPGDGSFALFEACLINVDSRGLQADHALRLRSGGLALNNSTVFLQSDPRQAVARQWDLQCPFTAVQSIVARSSTGRLIVGVANSTMEEVQATLDWSGNWLFNVNENEYHAHTGLNTSGEWLSRVDTAVEAVTGVDPIFTNALAGDLLLAPGSPIRTATPTFYLNAPVRGVFGREYDGRYGAQQFGPGRCPGDLNDDETIDGADLGLLLGGWGLNDPILDLNADGVVDGADLGLLLGAWGPCNPPL